MSSSDKGKLRIADPFEEDNDRMLQRLIDEAYSSISHGKNKVNLMQASAGLEFVFKRLQPVVPLPDREWYSAVFRNYDIDRDGEIGREAFEDIIRQYHAHHYERVIRRSRRRPQPQLTEDAYIYTNNRDTSSDSNGSSRSRGFPRSRYGAAGRAPVSSFSRDWERRQLLQLPREQPAAGVALPQPAPLAAGLEEAHGCFPAFPDNSHRPSESSLHCSSCGSLLLQHVASAAENDSGSNMSSSSIGWGGLIGLAPLRFCRSKELGMLYLPTLLRSRQQQQNQRQPLQHESGGEANSRTPLHDGDPDTCWGVGTPLGETASTDQMSETGNAGEQSRRSSSSDKCSSDSLPRCYPLFVTLTSLGAPYTSHPLSERAPCKVSKDWTSNPAGATAEEAVGSNMKDSNGVAAYSDSSDDSFFVPRPTSNISSGMYEPPNFSNKQDTRTCARTGSSLIEPKWPASWGGSTETTGVSGTGRDSSGVTGTKARGARRRAQEALHALAAKFRGDGKSSHASRFSIGSSGSADKQQQLQLTTHRDSQAATPAGPAKVQPCTSPKNLLLIVPSSQPCPRAPDESFATSEASPVREQDSRRETQQAVAVVPPTPRPQEEESSCCYWLFCCCSAGLQVESADTNIVTKNITEPQASDAKGYPGRAKSKSRRKHKGRRGLAGG